MSAVADVVQKVPLVGAAVPAIHKLGAERALKLGEGMLAGGMPNRQQQPMTGGPQITVSPQPAIDPWGMLSNRNSFMGY